MKNISGQYKPKIIDIPFIVKNHNYYDEIKIKYDEIVLYPWSMRGSEFGGVGSYTESLIYGSKHKFIKPDELMLNQVAAGERMMIVQGYGIDNSLALVNSQPGLHGLAVRGIQTERR